MRNTVQTNGLYATHIVGSALPASESRAEGAGQASYAALLASLQAAGTDERAAAAREGSMAAYRAYIWQEIDSIPFSPTRPNDEEIIRISDACWERMKSDPDYEQKMLGIIAAGRQQPDPFCGMGSSGTFWVLDFDGGEGCRSHGWSKNSGSTEARKRFDTEAEDAFWTNRRRRAKRQAELDLAYYDRQRRLKSVGERLARIRDMRARQQGLLHTSSDMPILGVPAEFLLAGLMGGMAE